MLGGGGMCGWEAGMAGGHVWWGACMAGGMHGGGHVWWGACMAGGHAWPRACVAEGGMQGRGWGVHATADTMGYSQ